MDENLEMATTKSFEEDTETMSRDKLLVELMCSCFHYNVSLFNKFFRDYFVDMAHNNNIYTETTAWMQRDIADTNRFVWRMSLPSSHYLWYAWSLLSHTQRWGMSISFCVCVHLMMNHDNFSFQFAICKMPTLFRISLSYSYAQFTLHSLICTPHPPPTFTVYVICLLQIDNFWLSSTILYLDIYIWWWISCLTLVFHWFHLFLCCWDIFEQPLHSKFMW